jgi:hypothetical protein
VIGRHNVGEMADWVNDDSPWDGLWEEEMSDHEAREARLTRDHEDGRHRAHAHSLCPVCRELLERELYHTDMTMAEINALNKEEDHE